MKTVEMVKEIKNEEIISGNDNELGLIQYMLANWNDAEK
jgi:hypothetical protein